MKNLPVEVQGRVIEVPSGCWEWQGYRNPAGYGQIRVEWKAFLVHRFVYMRIKGWFDPKLFVMHSCDNPACCNPDHLSLGTAADNAQDAVSKGRMNQKEANGRSKLTSADVEAIRELYKAGSTQSDIARHYDVNRSCIWKIVHNTHWRS